MTVAAAFDRAADYDAHAGVQARVAAALAERIIALPLASAARVLEIGCGTGFLGAALLDRMPHARWTMTDIAPSMLDRARAKFAGRGVSFATMDGERPDIGGGFDLVCSSLAAQWFGDLPAAVARWRTLLAPGGRIAFTTLSQGSFAEWRGGGIHDYPDAATLAASGLTVSIETIVEPYADGRAFLRALKAIGAGTPRVGHRPLAPAALRAALADFEAAGSTATYRVATCLA